MATAEVKSRIELEISIKLDLTLDEARALEKITTYGVDAFLQGYYKHLGKSYLQPYEKGVRSLFKTIQQSLPMKLYDADNIIKAVNEIKLNPQGNI